MNPTRLLIIGAALVALGLAGCTNGGAAPAASNATAVATPTSDTSAVFAAMVATDAGTLSTDLSAAATPLENSDFSGAETAIDTLAADVATFQNDLAVNPAPAQFAASVATIKTALADYSTGCIDAESGLSDLDSGQISEATTLFDQGNALLGSAVSEIG